MRQPQQLRSKESFERVLAVGIEVLQEAGYEGLSIAQVCARAGVSVGSIYARFKSKAALFAALQIRALETIDAEQSALFVGLPEPGSTDEHIVETAIRRVADHILRHERILRVMILRGAVDEETRRRGSASSLELAEQFEAFLLNAVTGLTAADQARAVDVAFRILYATLSRRVMSGPSFESRRPLDWDALVDELCRALCAYLLDKSVKL